MRELDEIDRQIVQSLIDDSRRPYSEIATQVGLSPPAVSDRVARLEEQGVIRDFTIDVDRTKLQQRVPVMVHLEVEPAAVERVFEAVNELEGVEHVFELFDGSVVAYANAPETDVHAWFREGLEFAEIVSYDVTLVAASEWNADVTSSDFAVSCIVCDNEVGNDGVTTRIDGEIKAFCCPSCQSQYEERYETHKEEAE